MSVRRRPVRVLHCPTDVGGHPGILAAAERRLGLDSELVTLAPSPLGFDGGRSLTAPGASIPRVEAARLRLLARALRWADVVHLNFAAGILPTDTAPTPSDAGHGTMGLLARRVYRTGRRLLSGRDLHLLRAAGKVIVVTMQGDDIRPTVGHPAGVPVDVDQDRRKRALVAQFDRTASAIYAVNPDLLAHLPSRAEFLPYTNVDLRATTPTDLSPGGPIRIAHAPTNRSVKGTVDVIAAVERARSRGAVVELDLVEGVDHATAMRRLAAADLLVDQLKIGWYGGVAVEAMALGRPVVAFVADDALDLVPPEMRDELPILRADAATLAEVIVAHAARSDAERRALAARSRAFAQRWHDPDMIADRMAETYARALATSNRRGDR